jgi:multiple sugar transport system ATP-binding protein
LRLIAGLEQAEAGTLSWGQENLEPMPPHQRDIALVFQNFSLYPKLTVRENLLMPLQAPRSKLSYGEAVGQASDMAGWLGLSDKLDRRPSELSGGEMQRVAIGRALVRRPRLLLLDEPFSHLDAKLRERMRTDLRRWHASFGIPMIFVTHDHEEAMGLGDRILVLDSGRAQQIGTPEEVYRYPDNSRVAKMLGRPPINLLTFEQAKKLGIPPGPGPFVGIRPEAFRLIPTPLGGAIAKAIEHQGPVLILVLEAEGFFLRLTVPPTTRIRLGDRFRLEVDPGDLWWMLE